MKNCSDSDVSKELEKILLTAKKEKFIRNGCVGLSIYNNNKWIQKFFSIGGATGFVEQQDRLVYDLASLTKPLVTSLSVLSLESLGKIDCNKSLESYVGVQKINKNISNIRIIDLLNHRSGLPAHREYFRDLHGMPSDERMDYVIKSILEESLLSEPGKTELYSDLGYIILGQLIETLTGLSLDAAWKKLVLARFAPDTQDIFFPSKERKAREFVKTGLCPWSGQSLRGLVHDDNCRALGGISGHAGLFGTCAGVLFFTEKLAALIQGRTHGGGNTLLKSMYPAVEKRGSQRWVFGFDTPSREGSSSGSYFSRKTIGHLGFTGTSFWIDLKRSIIIVMLTDRVVTGRGLEGIRSLRPAVHDCIMKRLTN